MGMAISLREYLDRKGISYQLIEHDYAPGSSRAAAAAHLSGSQVAKAVLLADERGYLLAAVPATHRVQLGLLHRCYKRHLGLATEKDLEALFDDCEAGAVPPLGEPYGLNVLVDMNLARCRDIYFEAGDHREFVHLRGQDFRRLLASADHGYFSVPS